MRERCVDVTAAGHLASGFIPEERDCRTPRTVYHGWALFRGLPAFCVDYARPTAVDYAGHRTSSVSIHDRHLFELEVSGAGIERNAGSCAPRCHVSVDRRY